MTAMSSLKSELLLVATNLPYLPVNYTECTPAGPKTMALKLN